MIKSYIVSRNYLFSFSYFYDVFFCVCLTVHLNVTFYQLPADLMMGHLIVICFCFFQFFRELNLTHRCLIFGEIQNEETNIFQVSFDVPGINLHHVIKMCG
jgi:hypothetical protein